MSTKAKAKVEGRPSAAYGKIVEGAFWALGAGAVTYLFHRLLPSEPTVVVLARDKDGDGKRDEEDDD